MEREWKPNVEVSPACPRCASPNTKFCYYNNYSLTQPRYFCKSCRRYWTKGGSLRNVPVGGGCRKTRRGKSVRARISPQIGGIESASSSIPPRPESCPTIDLAAVYANFLNQPQPQPQPPSQTESPTESHPEFPIPSPLGFSDFVGLHVDQMMSPTEGDFLDCTGMPFPCSFSETDEASIPVISNYGGVHAFNSRHHHQFMIPNNSNNFGNVINSMEAAVALPPLPGEEEPASVWPPYGHEVMLPEHILPPANESDAAAAVELDGLNSELITGNLESPFREMNLDAIFRS